MSAVRESLPMQFRPMREEDLGAVLTIETRAYTHPWTPGIFRDCLRAGYSCWVLEVDDCLAGYGIISVAVGETHILNICIDPELHGRGLGRQMMEHLLKTARGHGAKLALLEVRPSNVHAIRLYESMGFSEVGQRKAYYPAHGGREDAIVMALGMDEGADGEHLPD